MVWIGRVALLTAALSLGASALAAWFVSVSHDAGAVHVPLLFGTPIVFVVATHRLFRNLREPPSTKRQAAAVAGFGAAGALLGPLFWQMGYSPSIRGQGESSIVNDVRAVISAQHAYKSANLGHYDGRLHCLSKPWECIPGYPRDFPIFLDDEVASLADRNGYERAFRPARPSTHGQDASPTSVEAFAYVAVPLEMGVTGVRRFCGDDTGIVCATFDGSTPSVEGGRCLVGRCAVIQ